MGLIFIFSQWNIASKKFINIGRCFSALNAIKKLGINSTIKKNKCIIYGKGISGYNYKKNITIDAKNSGTLGRIILGLLINSPYPIKLIGDKSLSKRDFNRVADPLQKFGARFLLTNKKKFTIKDLWLKKFKNYKLYRNKRISSV